MVLDFEYQVVRVYEEYTRTAIKCPLVKYHWVSALKKEYGAMCHLTILKVKWTKISVHGYEKGAFSGRY